MSNGVQILLNMKSYIFLIILLGFIRIIFCSQPANVTENVCPVTRFRRKRDNGEYTRWRSNIETTPEFIVKVLDDEVMLTGTTNQLVAVNIVPATKRSERIIVGGAIVPTPTSASTDPPRDYTRFMPPTVSVSDSVQDSLLYLATTPVSSRNPFLPIQTAQPSTRIGIAPPYLPPNSVRNANRDESPPVSPQFLPRARPLQVAQTRQYVPIAPVAFTRCTTGTPLTPPKFEPYHPHPTRSPLPMSPTRTFGIHNKLDDFHMLEALIDDEVENQIVLTRSTLKDIPLRTQSLTKTDFFDDELEHFLSSAIPVVERGTTEHVTDGGYPESDEKELSQRKLNTDGDKDANYNNMFFYNTDYKDGNSKKELDIQYDDKVKEENAIGTSESRSEDLPTRKSIEESDSTLSVIENKTADVHYPEDSFDSSTPDNFTDESKISTRIPDDVVSMDKKRFVCNLTKMRPLNFNQPRTLPEVVNQLQAWTDESPAVKLADITGGNFTTMENPIYIVIVDDPSVGQVASEKQNVLLVAGINGRDHHSVTAAMFILFQLIYESKHHHDLLSKYRFWVIPVFNPDGYDYSMTFPRRRKWVKNLRQTWDPCKGRESCQYCSSHGLRCTVSPCYGVNLDRNFEYQWIPTAELRAEHPCGNLYAGTRQMSEVETQALSNFIHQQGMIISVFIALKEGAELGVMYPYSHTKKRRAFDQIYRQRAAQAAASANSVMGRKYISGQTSEFLPLYAGGIEDWADGHLGIDNTYTVMIFQPNDTLKTEYLTEKVIHEAYAATDSLLISCLSNPPPPPRGRALLVAKSKASSLYPTPVAFVLTSITSFVISHYYIYKNTDT